MIGFNRFQEQESTHGDVSVRIWQGSGEDGRARFGAIAAEMKRSSTEESGGRTVRAWGPTDWTRATNVPGTIGVPPSHVTEFSPTVDGGK